MAATVSDPWGSSNRSFDAHADLLLERLGGFCQFVTELVAKVFEAGSFQSWPYWLPRKASRNDLTSLSLSKKTRRVGEDSLGGCRGLSLLGRKPQREGRVPAIR